MDKTNEAIVCSAIKLFNITDVSIEVVIPCVRHWDIYALNIAAQFRRDEWLEKELGFLTSSGRFVSGKEAFCIAKENGQIKFSFGREQDELCSWMIY